MAVGEAGLGINIRQFHYLLGYTVGLGLGDEFGGLDAIHHQTQFIWLELRLGDVVSLFAEIVFNRNMKIHMEAENVIVDGFRVGFNIF